MTEGYDHDFWTEVSRAAQELGVAHGWAAESYAAKQAERGLAEDKSEEHRFWKAVAASLKPR